MDRSFLSQEEVIEASRNFVCIRTATYEDAQEAEFLRWVFTRNDNLENTVFCMLSPDGVKKLVRGDRGPMSYRRASDLARKMNQIAKDYPANDNAEGIATVPRMKDVRLGLNVAACDSLPTVVVMAETDEQMTELASKISPQAWSEDYAGMFIYCGTNTTDDVSMIKGMNSEPGIYFVEPDDYGLKGEVLAQIYKDATEAQVAEAFAKVAKSFERPRKDHNSHVRSGKRNNINWETEIPVEDPMAKRAQGRSRGR